MKPNNIVVLVKWQISFVPIELSDVRNIIIQRAVRQSLVCSMKLL